MDFFENNVSYDTLTHRLNEVLQELSIKYKKITLIAFSIWILLAGIGLFFIVYYKADAAFSLIPILGGGLAFLISYLIIRGDMKAKIKNRYLNHEVVNLYNQTEGNFLNYEIKPIFNKKFNQEMALFVRYANAGCKYKMFVEDPSKFNYEILRSTLTTSDGKNTTIHFDGDYVILDFPTNQHFHIKHRRQRTNRKGFKFYKIDDPEHHVYLSEIDYNKEEKRVIRPLNRQFLSLYSFVKEVYQTDKISIGSNMEQIHIAISEKVKFKLPDEFNHENVQKYYDDFLKVVIATNQVVQYLDDQEFM